MDCYLIPSANGLPASLAATQSDARALLRSRGIKGHPKDFEHKVPTKKADLLAYIDELLERADGTSAMPASSPASEPATELGMAADGFPEHRVGYSQAIVDAMFSPRPPALRELCYQISKLNSADLAHAAFEVAHAFARRGA